MALLAGLRLGWQAVCCHSGNIDIRSACTGASSRDRCYLGMNVGLPPAELRIADFPVRCLRDDLAVIDDYASMLVPALACLGYLKCPFQVLVHRYFSPQFSNGPSTPAVNGTDHPSVVVMQFLTICIISTTSVLGACSTISSCTGTIRSSVRSA